MRILLATLVPLVFVFTLVIITISNIIYVNSTTSAREAVLREAEQIGRQFAAKLGVMEGYLTLVSRGMAGVDPASPEALDRVNALVQRLQESDTSFFSSWYAFEPGAFPGEGHVYRTLVRKEGGVAFVDDMTPEILRDPAKSPWYNVALRTGKLYLDLTETYDYGLGEGPRVAPTMTAPVIRQGRAIGAVGIDIRYADMFETGAVPEGSQRQLLLLSRQGTIVFSENGDYTGRRFFDYDFPNMDDLKAAMKDKKPYLGETRSPLAEADSLICLYPVVTADPEQVIFLYLSTPVQTVYGMALSSIELIISTSILGLILLGFSVFVATRNIVKPIKQLTVDFDTVSNGGPEAVSLEETVAPTNVVELDILRASLRKMLVQIHQAHELRLRAAEEQVEKEKVLAASQAKSQFLANMSHEIRTPMNAILGISEILLHSDHLNEQERKYIQDIKISSDALLTIINDILDISKLESGKLSLEEHDFNFHALLENMRAMGEYLAAPNHVAFEYATSGDLPVCLRGDEVRLRQIVLNLLSNACKFTTKGTISFHVAADGDSLRFVVADTGPGISEEDQVSLFKPFLRFDAARNRKVQGTGLGLSICKSLVDLMGGTIAVESEYGKGAAFTVVIPKVLGEDCPVEDGAAIARAVYAPGVRVLIVDDNEINLSVAEGLLTDIYGIACDTALSGAQALKMVAAADYTLIFMDQMMPEMDGMETTGRIRAMGGAYATMPVIALTANAVKGAREMLLAAGINDYLTKPINVEELGAMLDRWIPDSLKVQA